MTMPLYMMQWNNKDVSFVLANDREEAAFMLDAEGTDEGRGPGSGPAFQDSARLRRYGDACRAGGARRRRQPHLSQSLTCVTASCRDRTECSISFRSLNE